MRTWQVLHTQVGAVAELLEVSWWAWAVSEGADRLCGHTGHVLCGDHMPQCFWRIPLGRPEYEAPDEDGARWLVNSLGSRLHDLYSRALFLGDRRSWVVARVPLGQVPLLTYQDVARGKAAANTRKLLHS